MLELFKKLNRPFTEILAQLKKEYGYQYNYSAFHHHLYGKRKVSPEVAHLYCKYLTDNGIPTTLEQLYGIEPISA